MSDLTNAPEREIEDLEDELDLALVRLGAYQDVGAEDVPLSLVEQLSEGANPTQAWRQYRGMSLEELAQAARIPAALLIPIESGREDLPLRTMAAIARALRLDLDDLVPWPR